jgi:hypothetical protein
MIKFRPTIRQLETIAECIAARVSPAQTAAVLGIAEGDFVAWGRRLANAREAQATIAADNMREARLLTVADIFTTATKV